MYSTTRKKLDTTEIILVVAIAVVAIATASFLILHGLNGPGAAYEDKMAEADSYMAELDYDKAEAAYLEAIDIAPRESDPYQKLYDMYKNQGEDKKAEEVGERAREAKVDNPPGEPGQPDRPDKPVVADNGSWKSAYWTILYKNEDEIRGYHWQNDKGFDELTEMEKQIALCDVTGDGIPELFFFTEKTDYDAVLNIYTFDGKNAKAIDYDFTRPCEGWEGEKEDCYHNVAAGGGGYFVVYSCKEDNHFVIIADTTDETIRYTIHEYEIKGEHAESVNVLEKYDCETWGYGYENESNRYHINGEDVSESEYNDKYDTILSYFNKAILYSGDMKDSRIDNKFSGSDALGMSFDEAESYLND